MDSATRRGAAAASAPKSGPARAALSAFTSLTRLEVRRRLRSSSSLVLGLVAALAIATAYLLPGGASSRGAAAALEAAMLVVILATGLVVTGAAASHPDDRASGAAEWLGATGAPSFARRVAPAAATATVAFVFAGVAALAGAALAGATGLAVSTRVAHDVAVGGAARLVAAAKGVSATVAVIPADAASLGDLVEADVRPIFRHADDAVAGTTTLFVGSEDVERRVLVPVRGTVALGSTRGAVRVRAADPNVDVVVRGARRLGSSVPSWWNALLVALLVGAALACGAPTAALLSRATSAPTAALATAVLLLVGATRDGLLELAAGADAVSGGAMAAAVLRGAAVLAPDLSALGVVGEAAAGRAIPWSSIVLLGPALAHAFVVTLLLGFVPDRRRRS